MSNPFDLKNYKPKIDMRDVQASVKHSYQQSAAINRSRMKGKEPSTVQLPNTRDDVPQRFVTYMPQMPTYDERRRAAKKGKT